MGTARRVRGRGEELSADDAVATLRKHGRWPLFRDALVRFRYADGFSHARALAFQTVLAVVPFVIAVIGLSEVMHTERIGKVAELTIERFTAGPSADMVREVLDRSRTRAGSGGSVALWFGLVFSMVNLVTAMSQIERGANRIYGIERDRPADRKYGRGVLMAVLAGLPMGAGFVVLVAGPEIAASVADVYQPGTGVTTIWTVLRWPLGFGLALLSAVVIFRRAPRRKQPGYSWLAFGAAVHLVLWMAATWLLRLYLRISGSFDAVYGPLSAGVSLLVWAYLTAIALLLGISFAAQLEADRNGQRTPVSPDPGADQPERG
ncbi:YihY/virulence factor BrkB family protein [Kitasatospora sp. NPDC101801]|uniref:YihY/virulence factor BrkB family protein n=1 Tax=Kitasatospora sp. NPDC101801 TaxID=3364103 RepID=UPI00382B1503